MLRPVEITDDRHKVYAADKEIKVKTKILKWSLCDYSNAYTLK